MELVLNNNFADLSFDDMCMIDGGKAWYTWMGDVAVAVGAVALVVGGTAVSPLLAAGYAGATYFYGRNREN